MAASGTSVGFIGTGIVGTPMVRQLLQAGHEVTVWNRTSEKSRAPRAPGRPPS